MKKPLQISSKIEANQLEVQENSFQLVSQLRDRIAKVPDNSTLQKCCAIYAFKNEPTDKNRVISIKNLRLFQPLVRMAACSGQGVRGGGWHRPHNAILVCFGVWIGVGKTVRSCTGWSVHMAGLFSAGSEWQCKAEKHNDT